MYGINSIFQDYILIVDPLLAYSSARAAIGIIRVLSEKNVKSKNKSRS